MNLSLQLYTTTFTQYSSLLTGELPNDKNRSYRARVKEEGSVPRMRINIIVPKMGEFMLFVLELCVCTFLFLFLNVCACVRYYYRSSIPVVYRYPSIALPTGYSCVSSLAMAAITLAVMQVFKNDLAADSKMTILGGFIGSCFFFFLLTVGSYGLFNAEVSLFLCTGSR